VRLFYQSLGVTRRSGSGPYAQKLSALLAGAASPGTTVEVHGLGEGRAIADQYRYLEYLDTAEILENGLRAEREGYDAFLIGNIFEPGLHALRELLNIPVLGLCEASVFLACLMGASFSVVNVNPKFTRRVTENIASYGVAGRLVSIDQMTVERPAVFDRAFEDETIRAGIIDQFRAAARQGLAKGAETIIPGGIVMTLLAEAGVHEIDLRRSRLSRRALTPNPVAVRG
jgi:allantoin racemase